MSAARSIYTLTDEVEELLAQLEAHPVPGTDALRERVTEALASARVSLERSRAGARIRRYAGSLDRYVTHFPRLGFLTGALVGALSVYLASRRII